MKTEFAAMPRRGGARLVRIGNPVRLLAGLAGLISGTPAWGIDPFTEEAIARGISYQTPISVPIPVPYGRGLAFADLDGDRDPDLVVTGAADGRIGVYQNNGGTFVSRSLTSGIPIMSLASGVVAFDYDGDDDLDLFITQWGASQKLLRNDGAFVFADVTAAAQLAYSGPGTGATVADYDGDGRLDLFVPMYGQANRLYRNVNGAMFAEVAASVGITGVFNSLQAAFFDMDNDGDKDVYVSNDRRTDFNVTEHNRLFENVGGTFVEISESSGTNVMAMSMNIAVGDLDNDGLQDLYCTNLTVEQLNLYFPNYLFMNDGNGVFSQQQQAAGVDSYRFGWGAVFLDYDNDGLLDLYVCNQIGANRFYVNKGAWPMIDEGLEHSVGLTGDSRCVATADIDGDGDVDMIVQTYNDRLRLFINRSGENRSWVRVHPEGDPGKRASIGAIVRVRTGANNWQMRELIAGSNYKVQNELVAHFGLGDASIVDEVRIQWPDGAERVLFGVPANRNYVVYHPHRLGDGNIDGLVDGRDVSVFTDVLLGVGAIDEACFDFNGDGQANMDDMVGFVALLLTEA